MSTKKVFFDVLNLDDLGDKVVGVCLKFGQGGDGVTDDDSVNAGILTGII